MRRLVKLEETESTYCFKFEGADESADLSFSVEKADLEFDVGKFYEAFFEGKKEEDVIEFQDMNENWSKEAKYVFGVVKSISDKVCEKLSPSSEDGR